MIKDEEDPSLRKRLESDSSLMDAIRRQERGDFKSAVKALKKALRIDPQNTVAWSELGKVLMRQGSIDGAIDAMILSIMRDKEEPGFFAWMNLSKLLAKRGRDPEAFFCLQKAQTQEIKEPGPPLMPNPTDSRGPPVPNPQLAAAAHQKWLVFMAEIRPRVEQDVRESLKYFEAKKVVPVPPKEPDPSRFI